MSLTDKIYTKMCEDILLNGVTDVGCSVRPKWDDGSPAYTVKKFGIVNRYNLRKEFPILTLRRTYWKSAIDEILWIYQKKSNRVSELNSKIWDQWADSEGTIGKAYGYQLKQQHTYREGVFDQVDKALYDLKHNPQSRSIKINMYNHSDLHAMNLRPCAHGIELNISDDTLNMMLFQRSQDVLVAGNWNVVQYAILLHMFAQVSGYIAGELVHVITDAHIYDRHAEIIRIMLHLPIYDAPVLTINPDITNFYDFTVDDFTLTDYKYNDLDKFKTIPVAV